MPYRLPSSRQYPDLQHQQDLSRLGEEITELAAHIHAATFQLLELIRIFDEKQGWGGDGDRSGGDRYLLNIHTEPETLKEQGEGADAELEGHGRVSAETSRRMACDASVIHWHETSEGETLNIGRKSRSIPPATRRVVQRRDGRCRFPGCTCSRFVDAHHVQHWVDGGE